MEKPPEPQSNQQTQEQRRAASAWKAIKETDDAIGKKYSPLVRGFPAMVQRDGLGPALAFLKAKGEKHHLLLYSHLSTWVLSLPGFAPGNRQDTELLPWLMDQSSATYRRATTEIQAYLIWLKRFAEAQKAWKDGVSV